MSSIAASLDAAREEHRRAEAARAVAERLGRSLQEHAEALTESATGADIEDLLRAWIADCRAVRGGGGSTLDRDFYRFADAIARATDIPVSAITRAAWEMTAPA
jgi:hypothetical protein